MNKKSGVALSTKNEAIFFGLANSFNNEIIVYLSFIKKGYNYSSLDLLFKMYKSKWNNSKKNSLGCLKQLDFNINNDQFIKQIIARWQKGQKIFAFLYWI